MISILLGLGAILAVRLIAGRLLRSPWAATLAASLFAVEPRFLFSSLSGMENNLLLALWAGGTAALFANRPLLSVILFSLAPVARPEAILVLPLVLPGFFMLFRQHRRVFWIFAAGLIPLVPVLSWMCFCWAATGHVLPNTYYLKAMPFHFSGKELATCWQALFANGLAVAWIYVIGLCGFLLTCVRRVTGLKIFALVTLLIVPAAYQAAVVGSRQILFVGYYWTRWLDPSCLMLAIPFCIGISACFSFRSMENSASLVRQKDLLHVLARTIGWVCLLFTLLHGAISFANRRAFLASDARAIHIMNVDPGLWIREHTTPGSVVAVNDAGAIRYFGQRHTLDLIGLNNATVAFKKETKADVIRQADWLVIFPYWFEGSPILKQVEAGFIPRKVIRIPREEYTICPSLAQTLVVIYQKKPHEADGCASVE